MRHEYRLGDIESVPQQGDQNGHQDVAPNVRVENRRLMREAKRRMATLSMKASAAKQQIQKDDSVLAAESAEGINASAQTVSAAEFSEADWPRPRALALIVVISLAVVVPSVTLRLLVWLVVLLLLTAVMLGPERARWRLCVGASFVAYVGARDRSCTPSVGPSRSIARQPATVFSQFDQRKAMLPCKASKLRRVLRRGCLGKIGLRHARDCYSAGPA